MLQEYQLLKIAIPTQFIRENVTPANPPTHPSKKTQKTKAKKPKKPRTLLTASLLKDISH